MLRRPERCELVAILASALAALPDDRFRDTHVRITAGVPLVGLWDQREIVQVLVNLLLDAAKRSAAGTPIVVTLDADPKPTADAPHGRARVTIQDCGSGSSGSSGRAVRHRARIFLGRRAKRVRERPGGRGAGLELSRRLAEAAGGRLWLERRADATAFILELPLHSP